MNPRQTERTFPNQKVKMKSKILASLFILLSFITYSQNSEIVINISGLRSDKGRCLVYLYSGKAGFPTNPAKAVKSSAGIILNGKSSVVMPDVADGEYALVVVHDENSNGVLDKNFIGMPKEGVGVSNNAKGFMGPPSYADSKFQLKNGSFTAKITIKYL